jgi:hypothetical protein
MSVGAATLDRWGAYPVFHSPYYYWFGKKTLRRSSKGVDT